MKKWFLLLFVVSLATIAYSQNDNSQVIGKWKYTVDTGSELWTGTFNFADKEGKLAGDLTTSEGTTLPFAKIELKEENKLNLEVKTEYDVITISLKLEGNKFSGTGASSQGEAPITGEKITEP